MHVEIQVALNFLISFLYNKLPRRRVNNFGEELEGALKMKFDGHWYPEKPYKGSAFRCLKTTPPLDPVFELASREAGMDLSDIQENLPQELSIWIDPGEVSYRMSEKGPVKILYSECDRNVDLENSDREVTRTFNPEAQCFKPIETMASQFNSMTLAGPPTPTSPFSAPAQSPVYKTPTTGTMSGFISKTSNPVTFTTAAFAQTKFGSTKLKTNSKRSHRMSPTEFSNYIKQRAILQQQAAAQQAAIGLSQQLVANNTMYSTTNGSPHNSRSMSPVQPQLDSVNNLMLMTSNSPVTPTSSPPTGSSMFGPTSQSPYSANLPSPTTPSSNRSSFGSGLFDSGYLADLLGSGVVSGKSSGAPVHHQLHHHHQQQQQSAALTRFASFLDKASPYISGPVSPGSGSLSSSPQLDHGMSPSGVNLNLSLSGDLGGSSNSTTSSNSAAKAFDNFNLNLNGVSYPNQYQHLLVAN